MSFRLSQFTNIGAWLSCWRLHVMRIICSSVSGFLNSVPLIQLVQDPFFVPQLFLLRDPEWQLNFKKQRKVQALSQILKICGRLKFLWSHQMEKLIPRRANSALNPKNKSAGNIISGDKLKHCPVPILSVFLPKLFPSGVKIFTLTSRLKWLNWCNRKE